MKKSFTFPENFKLGTATAALQIEGGDRNNNWFRWAEMGKIEDGSHCIVACDHWNRVAEDVALMKDLNCEIYRFGVEWSRIEPVQGKFDSNAIAHYRDEIEQLLRAGIEPLLTLHHFTNPLWFEDSGGWRNPKAPEIFENFTRFVVRELGDLVAEWVTINEPNVYLTFGYIEGIWPPGKRGDLIGYFAAAKNMIKAHLRAYPIIHEERSKMGFSDTKVGIANHLRIFDPLNGTAREKISAFLLDRNFQDMFVIGMAEGEFVFPIGAGKSKGKPKFMDFFGVNYYSRDLITANWNPTRLFGDLNVKENAPVNDLGWEIYPDGISRICKRYFEKYGLPIYITENGTCDAKDSFRTEFIYSHLQEIHTAISNGINIERYYHWTLMDNFEWVEGLSARFGLIEVDFETQKRIIRNSGKFYSEICKRKSVSGEMIKTYLS